MDITYFYSKKQKDTCLSLNPNERFPAAPNGEIYTEMMSCEGEHKSNYEDAVVVYKETGCEVDKFMLRITGKKFAKSF